MHQELSDIQLEIEEAAKDFAKERLLSVDDGLFLVHSASVKYIALLLAKDYAYADQNVLIAASWLHNIGKGKASEHHDVIGYEDVKSKFKNMSSDFYYKLSDCVLNHCCSKKPETEEGIIIRDADKIAFLHPTYLDFVKSEFDQAGTPEKFAQFLRDKIKFKEAISLPQGKNLFDEYSELAKKMI